MSMWLGGMVMATDDEMLDAYREKLMNLEAGETSKFKASLQSHVATHETALKQMEDDRRAVFNNTIDKDVDSVFEDKAKEMLLKVNLSILTKQTESPDPESQIIETPIPVEHVSKEGEMKKRFSEIVGEYVNVLSMLVGVAAILYASIIPCAMMSTFTYLIIFACIGIGLFGLMGVADVWKVVGERKCLARTDGPEPKSKWCYIAPPISKLVTLFIFSAFLTIFLRFLMYDKSCGQESGKPAEAPVVHWADQ